jgi:hypothetical protein
VQGIGARETLRAVDDDVPVVVLLESAERDISGCSAVVEHVAHHFSGFDVAVVRAWRAEIAGGTLWLWMYSTNPCLSAWAVGETSRNAAPISGTSSALHSADSAAAMMATAPRYAPLTPSVNPIP